MKKTRESKKAPSAESIAKMADRGQDVSRFFTNRGKMMQPIQRVNVDFTASVLQELDRAAAELKREPPGGDQGVRSARRWTSITWRRGRG